MKLSIIIPVYNEEQTIHEVIERVWAVDLGGIDREVIIANDGSSDGTRNAIDTSRWINDPRVKTYNSPINLGKGAAVRLGLAFATGDILLVQDADLELDPNEYGRLLAPILDGRTSIVYGSQISRCERQRGAAPAPGESLSDPRDQRAVRCAADRYGNRLQGVHARDARRHPAALRRLRFRA